ncbi:MAG: ABC transporter ATP-binding protein [Thaumarchaeota archaeon]|nr:ABC transporter ATP-binding protein [Nitrososphaerota archaeon]
MLLARDSISRISPPPLRAGSEGKILIVDHLTKLFPVRRTFAQSFRGEADTNVHAVDDVSFEVGKAQIYGLAGESGSGKTTVLRTVLRLTPPTSGSIYFEGKEISTATRREMKKIRPRIQVVFQDPYESMNPRMTTYEIVSEGLSVNNLATSTKDSHEKVLKALRDVQLTPPEEYIDRYPHELSGGQRQRVAIARALVLEPDLILADEPVSMLDVSVRAEVISVLLSIREKRGIAVLMVTHDLALSKDVVDQLGIMYLGKIVEVGAAEKVVGNPFHPYTQALIAAVPVPDPTAPKIRVLARGEIPTNISPPSGCRFHPRCSFAKAICSEVEPPLAEVRPGRKVACHFWEEAENAFLKDVKSRGVMEPAN